MVTFSVEVLPTCNVILLEFNFILLTAIVVSPKDVTANVMIKTRLRITLNTFFIFFDIFLLAPFFFTQILIHFPCIIISVFKFVFMHFCVYALLNTFFIITPLQTLISTLEPPLSFYFIHLNLLSLFILSTCYNFSEGILTNVSLLYFYAVIRSNAVRLSATDSLSISLTGNISFSGSHPKPSILFINIKAA